jgi:signal transduction histidine kinase
LGTRALGILVVSSTRDLRDLSRYEREALAGIVALVAIAIEKAQIYVELQETSANLQEANKQLAELDKAKSEFLSVASHQLYTPLTALRGYLSMLQEGDFGAIPEKQRDVVGILRASSDRLIALIRNLLDISRIESGRLELSAESMDLVTMARDLVTELLPNTKQKNLTLAFHEPEGEVPRVVADAQRVRQVLLNCLDNAIKYTDSGRIDIRVTRLG